MTVEVSLAVERSAPITATPEQAFALLCSIPDSAAHFQGLEALVPEQGGFTWRLQKTGVGNLSLQAIYGCRYTPDPATRTLHWVPLEGVGNTRVTGSWRVVTGPDGTRIHISNRMVLTLPVPRLMRGLVEPFVTRESARLIERYVENLGKTLSGGDGRVR